MSVCVFMHVRVWGEGVGARIERIKEEFIYVRCICVYEKQFDRIWSGTLLFTVDLKIGSVCHFQAWRNFISLGVVKNAVLAAVLWDFPALLFSPIQRTIFWLTQFENKDGISDNIYYFHTIQLFNRDICVEHSTPPHSQRFCTGQQGTLFFRNPITLAHEINRLSIRDTQQRREICF